MSYEISKRMEIAGCHQLNLPYESKCNNRHGHNWIITVYMRAEHDEDLQNGMVVDFTHVKREIHDYLDHGDLNQLLDFRPTAENMSKWICEKVDAMNPNATCYKVEVQESEGNIATYYNN